MITDILESGYYRRHTERLRERLARARRVSIAALTECGVTPAARRRRRRVPGRNCRRPARRRHHPPRRRRRHPVRPGTLFLPSGGGNNTCACAAYASDPAVLACLREGWTHWGEAVAVGVRGRACCKVVGFKMTKKTAKSLALIHRMVVFGTHC